LYRRRPGDATSEPPQVYGSTQIELAWTVVPFLIVVVLFLVTARHIWAIENRTQPSSALEVTIVGNQWWWEIRYPKLGVVTANELHVPVSDPANPTPTYITLQSADVIHSFWVPQLAGKMDVIPNKTNRVWIDPHTPGTYVGQCAEYCGLQHALMLLVVVVHPREEFDRWVAAQKAPPPEPEGDAAAGKDLFARHACVGCHTIRGVAAGTLAFCAMLAPTSSPSRPACCPSSCAPSRRSEAVLRNVRSMRRNMPVRLLRMWPKSLFRLAAMAPSVRRTITIGKGLQFSTRRSKSGAKAPPRGKISV
jgi:cytochrome c oxidase subunit II